VLPKAPNGKTHPSERLPVYLVSVFVSLQFKNPIAFIRFRHMLVLWARVIETAICKDRQTEAWN
jgi:hypothetical protein